MPGPLRVSIVAGALIAGALLLAPPAKALVPSGVPAAANSTIPACVVASPDGTFLSAITVRDLASNPVSGSRVTLDFSTCAIFVPCSFPCSGCTASPSLHTVSKFTDASGVASFDLRMGGTCPNERVTIFADGVPLGTAAYSSLDQNGDLSVTGADMLLVQAAILSGDLSADFDCSGTVTTSDLTIANAHVGVTCNGVVRTTRHTWGTLKGAYR
jgi:hypothetical protein